MSKKLSILLKDGDTMCPISWSLLPVIQTNECVGLKSFEVESSQGSSHGSWPFTLILNHIKLSINITTISTRNACTLGRLGDREIGREV